MGKISMLDCTLRDGGYINDWRFGVKAIRDVSAKMARTGVEYLEIGFIKDVEYDEDRSIFTSNAQMARMIAPKNPAVQYVGMIDMGAPMPIEKLGPRQPDSIDILRVIFKKDRIDEGFAYCQQAKQLGYEVFVQIVATSGYSDLELIGVLEKFDPLHPSAIYIVDTLGALKRRDFLRMVQIADHNLSRDIMLGYHSHNNLQQAAGNAEAFAELNLQRDIMIDACVFGMGRGAGNLNMELFAQYLNDNYSKSYLLEPMLEIIDEYLNEIYQKEFWGYSLPYYLSAANCCHPNYAKYFAAKGTLTVKAFNEILKMIPAETKEIYKVPVAEKIYLAYMENYIDDRGATDALREKLAGKEILLLGSGKRMLSYIDEVQAYIEAHHPVVISLNFVPQMIPVDYVFSSHSRRYRKLFDATDKPIIITSNIRDAQVYAYQVNFSSYACEEPDIVDNSGMMCLNLLMALGNTKVALAGLDGYSEDGSSTNYLNSGLEYRFSAETKRKRNELLTKEIARVSKTLELTFLTPSVYGEKE